MSLAIGAASMNGAGPAVVALRDATIARHPGTTAQPARFALIVDPAQDPVEQAATIEADLAPLGVRVTPLSTLDPQVLVVEIPNRTFGGDAAAFAAAHTLEDAFDLEAAEPDLPTDLFPEPTPAPSSPGPEPESTDFPVGCRAPREDALDSTPLWALDAMRVQQAWAFSEARQRPDRGAGVIIAQPDTGITVHAELAGVLRVSGFDVLDGDPDPADSLAGGNPGHGTGTASVLVSLSPGRVTGSAPRAQHMAIRAIESVVRISQVSVARAIDWAVEHGAHVITMSLGGIPAFSLHRALRRAVQADVIVLAAAGNCVRTVVWPARYDDCIAVAGVDVRDARWRGSCHGAAVDIAAPGENVLRATVPTGADQGQGTSFAVALTAGVAGLWLAHHGRANLVAAARARGETLQVMFRRLLGTTARRPAGWDSFEMGAGIVDAHALLAADLDIGRDRETVEAPADPREAAALTVESLVAEVLGHEATRQEPVDWYRHGPELAAVLLRRCLDTPPADAGPLPESPAEAPGVSSDLALAVANPRLRAGLGLNTDLEPEVGQNGGTP